MDNCILEDGMVYVQNPGSCHVKFCTFRHATIILQHLNSSIIENCEFSQTDSAAITVEGNPRNDKNWTYGYMLEKTSRISSIQRIQQNIGYDTAPTSAYSTSSAFTQKKSLEKSDESKTDSVSGMEFGGHGTQPSTGSMAHMPLLYSDVTEQAAIHSSLIHNFNQIELNTHKLGPDLLPYYQPRENSVVTTGTDSSGASKQGTKISTVSSDFASSDNTSKEKGSVYSGSKSENGKTSKAAASSKGTTEAVVSRHFSESNISADKYSQDSFISSASEPPASSSERNQNGHPVSSSRENQNIERSSSSRGSKTPTSSAKVEEGGAPQQGNDRSRSNSRSSRRSSRSNSPISMASGSEFFEDDEDSIGGFDSGSGNSSHRGK